MKRFIFIFLLFSIQPVFANHHEEKIIIERADIGSEIFNLGKEVYKTNCASCHQPNLSGQVGWKDKLDNDGHRLAPPMNGTGHTWHHDDKTLFYITKYGLAKLVPKYEGKMMGFDDQLNDQEIKSVLAYIKSFWTDDKYQYQMKLN
jgi:mono/diheme cytochrome c family protein